MVTPDFIEKLKQVLETSGVTQADVSYVVTSWWTQDQVPEIKNEYQYQDYLTLWHINFRRSRQGIYLDSIGARLIEWEEKAKSGRRPEPATLEELLDFIRAGCRED
jgi:hypothetical protein